MTLLAEARRTYGECILGSTTFTSLPKRTARHFAGRMRTMDLREKPSWHIGLGMKSAGDRQKKRMGPRYKKPYHTAPCPLLKASYKPTIMAEILRPDFRGAVAFDERYGKITISPTVRTNFSDGASGPEIRLTRTSQVAISQEVFDLFGTRPLSRYSSPRGMVERVADILKTVLDSTAAGPPREIDPSNYATDALHLSISRPEAGTQSFFESKRAAQFTQIALNQTMPSILRQVDVALHTLAQEYSAPLGAEILGSLPDIHARVVPELSKWLQDGLSEGPLGEYDVSTKFSIPSRGILVGWISVAYTGAPVTIPFDVGLEDSAEEAGGHLSA